MNRGIDMPQERRPGDGTQTGPATQRVSDPIEALLWEFGGLQHVVIDNDVHATALSRERILASPMVLESAIALFMESIVQFPAVDVLVGHGITDGMFALAMAHAIHARRWERPLVCCATIGLDNVPVFPEAYRPLLLGKRALLAEVALSPESRTTDMIALLRQSRATVVGVAALCRVNEPPTFADAPRIWTGTSVSRKIYDPPCPLCAARIPVTCTDEAGEQWILDNQDYPVFEDPFLRRKA